MRNTLFAQGWATLFASLFALSLVGCGAEKKKEKKSDEEDDSADATEETGFNFQEDQEDAIDESVLKHKDTASGYHVVTLYFKGGSKENCAKWNVTITGKGIKAAQGEKLEKKHQDAVKEDGDDKVTAKFETRGGKDGIRLLVKAGTKLGFEGTQKFCKGKDATEFDVKVDVKKQKLKKLFEGVEGKGQALLKLRITAEKKGPVDAGKEDAKDEAAKEDGKKPDQGKDDVVKPGADGEKVEGDEIVKKEDAAADENDEEKKED